MYGHLYDVSASVTSYVMTRMLKRELQVLELLEEVSASQIYQLYL